ncbi:MAG: hydrogenase maturation nickel metallochaperone HypA [Candidatus Melainabacteria bacterium]|nr:MAG: hydrogenase maturation nickel metallochaperone HypA [Candidatus Melainabacteria bacterium]
MHELSIMINIVSIVQEHSQDQRVVRVKLEIGKLAAVVPDSLRFCFDVCTKGTNLEGAVLEIDEIEPLGECNLCMRRFPLDLLAVRCPCGSRSVKCVAGEELKVKEMEVE